MVWLHGWDDSFHSTAAVRAPCRIYKFGGRVRYKCGGRGLTYFLRHFLLFGDVLLSVDLQKIILRISMGFVAF